MNWEKLFLYHPTALYQLAVFPFVGFFHYLWISQCLSINARYICLLASGFLLACSAMGCYALLVFISTVGSVAVIHSAGPQQAHKWVFFFQMAWQTVCHMGLHYKEYFLHEAAGIRFSVALSVLMMMTQKATSLALDIQERKVRVESPSLAEGSRLMQYLLRALPFSSYLLSPPTLLGGPLCSFHRFQAWIKNPSAPPPKRFLWAAAQKGFGAVILALLKNLVRGYACPPDNLLSCRGLGCIPALWTSALFFRLAYYSHWMLDESIFIASGLGLELGCDRYAGSAGGVLLDTDIWTLETTNRIAVFTRSWNKSTAQWLKRLVFQRTPSRPLLATFAFSAWWHGLHPGQIFGFLCWAVMVEADYRIRYFSRSFAPSQPWRLLYQILTWCQTQLIVAYVMLAIEMRSLSLLWQLWFSYNSFFPLLYAISLPLLAKRSTSSPVDPRVSRH
ncbi:ghrelin O-acyltransferase [Eublepharis macularius]|uniref:Ghrelin O-acyltransferase n=1 Tax=Eublepharis macularius TaxID=481883 RepID=A0AA97L8M3_EUBMA|nr:ghrelin O-acyltransferase [Eublepharis macularius]